MENNNYKNIPTLRKTDELLEELWGQFEDIPMDPDTECIEEDFLHFPHGTNRETIWHWFDERYSKGVHALLYGTDGVDRTAEAAKMLYLCELCDECETRDCAYNHGGICRYAMVRGKAPHITEEDGCTSGVIDVYGNSGGNDEDIIDATFVNVMDDGTPLTTACKVNAKTKLMFDDEPMNYDGFEYVAEEYVLINGVRYPVRIDDDDNMYVCGFDIN